MQIVVTNSAQYAPRILATDSEPKVRKQVEAEDRVAAAMAALYRDNQVQWGHRPGVNVGNGAVEACIPITLLNIIQEQYPDWDTNDKTWALIMKRFPRFNAFKPGVRA